MGSESALSNPMGDAAGDPTVSGVDWQGTLRQDGKHVRIQVHGGPTFWVAADRVERTQDNAYFINLTLEDLGRAAERSETVMPVIQETLTLGKREIITGGLRVEKHTHEIDHPVAESLRRESLDVERVPIGRVVATAQGVREEGDTVIVPVYEEILVLEKRLLLKEEIRIHRRVSIEQHNETVRLRQESVDISNINKFSDV